MDHFNGLTPAQAERLAMLAEECGEVIQIVGKILRHGYDSHHPDQQEKPPEQRITNRESLGHELCDLFTVASAIFERDDVPEFGSAQQNRTWDRKLRFAHHQEELV